MFDIISKTVEVIIKKFGYQFRKRPMAMIGLILLLIAVIRLSFNLNSLYDNAPSDMSDITVQGSIYKIEKLKNSTAVYLKTDRYGRMIMYITNEKYDSVIKNITFRNSYINNFDYEFAIGNIICVEGNYQTCTSPGNPGEFNSRQYYAIRGIYGSLFPDSIEVLSTHLNIIPEGLRRVRLYLNETIETIYSEPYSGIMSAMLIGYKNNLDQDIKDLYSSCGIAHIIAISGLHISFLAGIIKKLFRKLMGFKYGSIVSLLIVLIYVFIAGASASAIRAYLFFAIMMIGELSGRGSDMPTAFFMSFGLMVTFKPAYLLDSGFVLSYVCISAIALLARLVCPVDFMEKYNRKETVNIVQDEYTGMPIVKELSIHKDLPHRFIIEFKTSIKMGLLLQVTTFPIILYYYYAFCPWSILLNLLVIPGMSVILGCGMLSLIVGTVAVIPAKIISIPAALMLRGYEYLCELTSGLPFGTVVAGKPQIWEIVLYYVALIFLLISYNHSLKSENCVHVNINTNINNSETDLTNHHISDSDCHQLSGILSNIRFCIRKIHQNILSVILCFVFLITFTIILYKPCHGFEITFLDVGQGDSIFMRSENGTTYLCDCGSSDRSKISEYVLVPFLKSLGYDRLDYVFITHGDSDHYNGITELMEDEEMYGISIGRIVMTEQLSVTDTGLRIIELAATHNIPISLMESGNRISEGLLSITCLYPDSNCTESGEDNNSSLVLQVDYDNISVLLCGDLEEEGEKRLLNNEDEIEEKSLMILKVGHHGSSGSSSEIFLDAVDPDIAVISYGENNRYGHPHEETLIKLHERQVITYGTAISGAVTVRSNLHSQVSITKFRYK